MGRGDTRVSDSECEKRKGKWKREKVRKLTMRERERRHQKIMFSTAIDKDHIYRRCNA